MKTNLFEKHSVIQRITRLPKLLLLAGVSLLMALPEAEARERGRDRDDDRRGGHSRYDRDYRHGSRHRGYSHHSHYSHYSHYPRHHYYSAPRYIRVLPRGYRTVYHGGQRCYYSNGHYYRPGYHNGSTVYFSFRF